MAHVIHISNPRSRSPWLVVLRASVFLCVISAVAVCQAALCSYIGLSRDLPAIPPFHEISFGTVSSARALHGQVLGERFEERRYLVPYERLPDVLVQAFIASEDERFFVHTGLDVRGILRAAWANIKAGKVREGASTITQQLARSLLLTKRQTFSRKVREAAVARRIEDIYSKDQILLLYLNLIYLGDRYYGVEAASLGFFGKDVSELSLNEAAAIAASAQTPHRVNPVRNTDELRNRRDRVIHRMHEAGFITAEQEKAAIEDDIRTVARKDNLGDRAPVPAMELMSLLQSSEGRVEGLLETRGGIKAVSTIDLGLQLVAQEAVLRAGSELGKRQGYRGHLASLEEDRWDAFLSRNGKWLESHGLLPDPPTGSLILAVVTEVDRKSARLSFAPGRTGVLRLADMKWAVPYTEFPKADPGTERRRVTSRVSFDGRLRAVDQALLPGQVILAERVQSSGQEDAESGAPCFALAQLLNPQAALMVVEPHSGYVLALVGGTDFDLSQVNRTGSLRQIGSTVKPIYYSKAYDLGIPPSTVVSGVPFREGTWTPTRGRSVDDMTLYEALSRSENNVSLRVFQMVLDRAGIDSFNDWVSRLGLSRPFEGYAAEGLGVDATPRDLLQAFSTFANLGVRPDFTFIREVRDGRGRLLRDNRSARDPMVGVVDALCREVAAGPESSRRSITKEVAWITARNLRDVVEHGTARKARDLGRPACGKTGTLPYDTWFVGWTHEMATVAWLGQDMRNRYLGRSKVSSGVYGSNTALPLWLEFMKGATVGRPNVNDLAELPEGVLEVDIDPLSGLLALDDGVPIPHMEGTEPIGYASPIDEVPPSAELAEF